MNIVGKGMYSGKKKSFHCHCHCHCGTCQGCRNVFWDLLHTFLYHTYI